MPLVYRELRRISGRVAGREICGSGTGYRQPGPRYFYDSRSGRGGEQSGRVHSCKTLLPPMSTASTEDGDEARAMLNPEGLHVFLGTKRYVLLVLTYRGSF
jgi:hypothetical protein